MGWGVTILAASPEAADNPWPARLIEAGCAIVHNPEAIQRLKDALCVDFCCQAAVLGWKGLKARGCRLIHVPCMCKHEVRDRQSFHGSPPDAVVFQSEYQKSKLWPMYALWTTPRYALIHGAFELADFPYKPRQRGAQFVVGKLARANSETKWPPHLWDIIGRARELSGVDIRLLCMGWDAALEARLGKPPEWAKCLPINTMTSREFLSNCHVLFCAGQADKENWPRVGLEAMAMGVPIIADNAGGWPEMLETEEETYGVLCKIDAEWALSVWSCARWERARLRICHAARKRVEQLANECDIGLPWDKLIREVAL
jgi:glycosyltransferase involved in cell wall biosynthesis